MWPTSHPFISTNIAFQLVYIGMMSLHLEINPSVLLSGLANKCPPSEHLSVKSVVTVSSLSDRLMQKCKSLECSKK